MCLRVKSGIREWFELNVGMFQDYVLSLVVKCRIDRVVLYMGLRRCKETEWNLF